MFGEQADSKSIFIVYIHEPVTEKKTFLDFFF